VDSLPRLLIGSLGSEYLLVQPTRLEFPDTDDYWDGNWVYADVAVVVGAFRGSYEAVLRTDEFARFRDDLQVLHNSLKGGATFETMERWLAIHIEGDGRGHFTAKCEARDQPGMGNQLTFELAFDQTELPAVLRDLDELKRAFPVEGTRTAEVTGNLANPFDVRKSGFSAIAQDTRCAHPVAELGLVATFRRASAAVGT